MQIVLYPHPTLRHLSKPIRRVDADLRHKVEQMFDLMYAAKGVGLAANQVDLPLRLFVVNPTSDPEEGEEFVFINPVLRPSKGSDEKEEGCLSMPELYGTVRRSEKVQLTAYNLEGEEFSEELDGLFARIVQHENDHLDGILFTDRLSETGKLAAAPILEEFEAEFERARQGEGIGNDAQIAARLAALENQYC